MRRLLRFMSLALLVIAHSPAYAQVLPIPTALLFAALLRTGLLSASLLPATTAASSTAARLYVSGRAALLRCTAFLQFSELRDARSIPALHPLIRDRPPFQLGCLRYRGGCSDTP